MEPDEYFKGLLERTGLPKWVVGGSVGIVAAAVGYVALSKLLEEAFALERPASPFVAATLILAVYWLVLVHTLRQRPLWIIGALCVLLAAAIYAVFKLWILYRHESIGNRNTPARPLSRGVIRFCHRVPCDQRRPKVRGPAGGRSGRSLDRSPTSAVLFAGAAVLVFFRPGELDFVADTIFADEAPEGSRVYCSRRTIETLTTTPDPVCAETWIRRSETLGGRDPELAKEISLVSLRRPIPGFEDGRTSNARSRRRSRSTTARAC